MSIPLYADITYYVLLTTGLPHEMRISYEQEPMAGCSADLATREEAEEDTKQDVGRCARRASRENSQNISSAKKKINDAVYAEHRVL